MAVLGETLATPGILSCPIRRILSIPIDVTKSGKPGASFVESSLIVWRVFRRLCSCGRWLGGPVCGNFCKGMVLGRVHPQKLES